MRGVGERRESEAPVVAGYEVSFWDARDGAVGRGAVALGYVTSILFGWVSMSDE